MWIIEKIGESIDLMKDALGMSSNQSVESATGQAKPAASPGFGVSGDWWNPFDDFIVQPGKGIAKFSPDDTVIGVKDTSIFGGGGGTQITNHFEINNPIIRNEDDIDALAEKISKMISGSASARGA